VPTIGCDYTNTPMKNYQSLQSNEIVAIQSESLAIVKATEWMKQILEAKYEKANIKDVVAQCKHPPNVIPYHASPYPILKVHEARLVF
jgi:hypothetical protein